MDEFFGIIKKTISDISEIKRPLEQIALESEPLFLRLGQDLQSIFFDAEELSSLTIKTAGMIDSGDDNLLANIGIISKESFSRLATSREDIAEVLPHVEDCAGYMKKLSNMCPVIKQIAKKLNIVALHISMESSRTRECEEMFSFFVKEIKQLAQKVQDISVKMKDSSETSGKHHNFEDIKKQKDLLGTIADNARYIVEENLKGIEKLIAMSVEVLHRSGGHSKRISSLVGEVVEAIQFHDISRQQLEHVTENISDAESLLEEVLKTGEMSETFSRNVTRAYAVIKLQAEQIKLVSKEVNAAYIKIKNSFTSIEEIIEDLVEDVARLGLNFSNRSQGDDNPFNSLITGLMQLDGIMNRGREMAESIETNFNQSAVTAKSLAGHLTQMEDISMDLHIKAVNALIMSKKLGEDGRTLSVLAEDVTSVSQESNVFVMDVVDILKSIDEASVSLSQNHTGESGLNSLSNSIEMIKNVYENFCDNSSLSVSHSHSLKNRISILENSLSFFPDTEAKLAKLMKRVTEISERFSPFIDYNDKSMDDLDHLEQRYTMESERGIHRMAMGGENGSLAMPEVIKNVKYDHNIEIENTGDQDDDYLGDNVELF